MALNRINGNEELYVGGVFGVNRPRLIQEYKITHILSVIKYSLPPQGSGGDGDGDDAFKNIKHLSIDIDDMDDQDILVHIPKMVRFIDRGLNNPPEEDNNEASGGGHGEGKGGRGGAVVVHCAMGKSRSVTAVVAYLLWKHPHRFGRADPTTTAKQAVRMALEWVRQTRPIAEPNDGFMEQLELWCEMGCPADEDDAVEREPKYQRWLYKREVELAAAVGRAPDWIRFEDEEQEGGRKRDEGEAEKEAWDLRCKKCRRVLATEPFVVPHQGKGNAEKEGCPHYFVEALSWMRGTLELGEMEGRLNCPTGKCGGLVGRYSWRGFKCSCGDWVAPAFSLQKSKVDRVQVTGKHGGGNAGDVEKRMAALGIRMPPGQRRKENL
ncbi:protein-tyrosine phosphatase-like protein [Cladorrhinum samala]|uniref:protein-tyrosine-phosphatase n=1 Tax=Cladorrhinum samala TaxID=585594 RepID=A0AAV9HLT4_9PEZI|nr:protein-tyrosine phosphatase-like protein [Cladorrhinum samala]